MEGERSNVFSDFPGALEGLCLCTYDHRINRTKLLKRVQYNAAECEGDEVLQMLTVLTDSLRDSIALRES